MTRHAEHGPRHSLHLLAYGTIFVVVIVAGGLAIWSFVERQSLIIEPQPLPKVTVVTSDVRSPAAAAWVNLLVRAEMQPTLVPLQTFEPVEGVVVLCDLPPLPHGSALVASGLQPSNLAKLQLHADAGLSDTAMRLSEGASPVLARLSPGYEVPAQRVPVALLQETPRMVIDARW